MSAARALLVLVALGGCTPPATRGEPVQPVHVAPPSPRTPTAPPDPALASFRDNLEHAKSDAERAGWVVREVVEIPDHHAALVIYDPSPAEAPAYKLARIDAVGAGAYQVVSSESGIVDVMKTRAGSLLWDLRGDGSRSVIIHLTPCGANCGVAKPLVLELDGNAFKAAAVAPECPTCLRDDDKDGVPELELRLASLTIAPCSRASCGPSSALLVEVRGVERWNGARYAKDLAVLAPLYAERRKAAQKDAATVKRTGNRSRICPLNALSVAARLYVYSRLTGESRGDALVRADEVMRGWDTKACSTEYDLLAPPKRWEELKKELEALSLPTLEAK